MWAIYLWLMHFSKRYIFRIKEIDEAGLVKIWKNRHWPVDACAAEMMEKKMSSRVLTIMDLKLAFTALAVGLGAACTSLLVESSLRLLRNVNFEFTFKHRKRKQAIFWHIRHTRQWCELRKLFRLECSCNDLQPHQDNISHVMIFYDHYEELSPNMRLAVSSFIEVQTLWTKKLCE